MQHRIESATKPSRSLARVETSLPSAIAHARILVADDDPITHELLGSISDRDGYRIVSVRDGREAYRLLRTDADFAVAILNMTMPHLHGVDIVRHMKTEKRLMRIQVIIVSGEGGIAAVADSFAAGAIAFLSKPFDVEQLRRTLRLALNNRGSKEIARRVG
jgi:DNA-binding NtrC family response regulator